MPKQLYRGCYGIYLNGELNAWVGCPNCEKFVKGFKARLPETNKVEVAKKSNVAMFFQDMNVLSYS